MEGLFLKIVSARDDVRQKPRRVRIAEFRINEESAGSKQHKIPVGKWLPITKEPKHEGSAFEFLKCVHCKHEDFSDDGERLCDYVCNGCGLTVSIAVRNQ